MELKTTGQGSNIQNKTYTYTPAGDIHTITDKLATPNTIYTYVYDNLHRLLQETTSDTTLPTDADIMTYTYGDSEHINAVTSIIYNGIDYGFTYDDNGNMKDGWDLTDPNNIVERDLTWNADNMPVTVTRGGVATNLTYDGDGVRAKKVTGGISTYYVSNDYEIKNGTPIKYIFAGNLRVAEIEGATPTIFHKDHLGSSTAMSNSAGAKVEGTEYLPFGGMRVHTGTDISSFKFTDQELDTESNLYNYDARLYDPIIGRFISADSEVPATYKPQSLNRYSYCLNNPLLYTDPSGHAWYNDWDDFKKMWRNFIVDDTPQEGAIWTSGYVEPDNPNAYEDHEKKDRPFTPSKKALLENMPKDFARNVTVGVLTRFGLEKLKKLGSGAGTTPTEENWPPNRGFEGDPEPTTLQPGKMIDRYGSDSGSFASPQGTPASARSLRPGTETKPLNTYEVVKPLDVDAGRTASWFGQPGGGTQYDLGRSVQELVKDGFLKPVP